MDFAIVFEVSDAFGDAFFNKNMWNIRIFLLCLAVKVYNLKVL